MCNGVPSAPLQSTRCESHSNTTLPLSNVASSLSTLPSNGLPIHDVILVNQSQLGLKALQSDLSIPFEFSIPPRTLQYFPKPPFFLIQQNDHFSTPTKPSDSNHPTRNLLSRFPTSPPPSTVGGVAKSEAGRGGGLVPLLSTSSPLPPSPPPSLSSAPPHVRPPREPAPGAGSPNSSSESQTFAGRKRTGLPLKERGEGGMRRAIRIHRWRLLFRGGVTHVD